MLKNNRARLLGFLCLVPAAAGCGGDDAGTPTAPTPPVTLTGSWAGAVAGALVGGNARATLSQSGTAVSGDWSMPMPAVLAAALRTPAGVDLAGPVTGTVAGSRADLSFGFLAVFTPYLRNAQCAIAVSVTSFTATTMEATWTTNDSCQSPVVDKGTLTFTRR